MKIGRVIGKAISARKEGKLDGIKLLVVEYLDAELERTSKTVACSDTIGAGEGDVVILCGASSARLTEQTKNTATDSCIIGIVDSISKGKEYCYQKGN